MKILKNSTMSMNLHTSVNKHSSARACRPHSDWLGSVTCYLLTHIHMHVSLQGTLGWVTSCVLIHMQASLQGRCPGSTLWHTHSAYQRQPKTMILKKSLSHEPWELGRILWGATAAFLPCLRLCPQSLLLALFEIRYGAGQISGLNCHSHSRVLMPWWQLDIFHAH